MGGDRAVIDDPPASRRLALHELDRFLSAEERAGEIDIHHLLPGIEGELFERHRRCADPGIVEEHIKPPERLLGLRKKHAYRGRVRDIGRDHQHRRPFPFGGYRVEKIAPPSRQYHSIPGVRQRERHRLADPAARPGHQRNLRTLGHERISDSEKSSSQNSLGERVPAARSAASFRRSSTRRILPEMVLGSSANSMRRIRLKGERWARAWARIEAAVARSPFTPGASAIKALGTASRIGSGEGTTAASTTASCSMSTLSSSNGLIR